MPSSCAYVRNMKRPRNGGLRSAGGLGRRRDRGGIASIRTTSARRSRISAPSTNGDPAALGTACFRRKELLFHYRGGPRPRARRAGPRGRDPSRSSGCRGCPRACPRRRAARRPLPPPGPSSMIQSDASRNPRWCSTASTEWPRAIRRRSVASSRSTSRACSPVVGSSKRKSAPREAAGRIPRKAASLQPLRLAAGERRGRLAQRACSRARLPAAARGGARPSPPRRRTRPRPRPSCRARRRCSCRAGARRARAAGTAARRRRRSAPSRRPGTACRSSASRCRGTPRSGRPTELKEKSRAVMPREAARADCAKSWRISSQAFV